MPVLMEDGVDAGLVWHYGNPVTEARALAAGEGIVGLGNRDVFELTGVDRLNLLHALSTQHVEALPADEATCALLLGPTGHIEHVLYGVDDGESFLGWTEPGRGDALVSFLDSMRFSLRVEVVRRADLSLAWAGHRVEIPEGWRRRDSELGGSEVFIPEGEGLEGNVGTWAFESMRIAAGVPRIFLDTDFKTIPNEIGLVGTHLNKGCYRGQETVARVHTLGRPPRRLVQLLLDGSMSELPALGATIEYNGRQVGFVGSSARHHELGPVALGMIKRNVPVDAEVLVDSIPASQEALVDPDVGLHVRPVLG
ncbi:CAF17-like 4Fe-4S cluster assembly/insertion protein YgfZ [Tessaracoccus flavescens]|uniref:Folate-binding protein YgfZ n=1 Tax=Tessaracoccus flavescens TaxID=399497 RepID=A0A1Q2CVW2_9ACTN|nr:folate-binding protein YgfZ [Tessaracoccus flavescens]AQP50201.1 folate-binding protein YgfZ [Tessaracoccus flavescens]